MRKRLGKGKLPAGSYKEGVERVEVRGKPLDSAAEKHRQEHIRYLPSEALETRVARRVAGAASVGVDGQHVDAESTAACACEAPEEVVPHRPEQHDGEEVPGVVAQEADAEEHVREGADKADDASQSPGAEPKADLPPTDAIAPVVPAPAHCAVYDRSDHPVDRDGRLHILCQFPVEKVIAVGKAILEPIKDQASLDRPADGADEALDPEPTERWGFKRRDEVCQLVDSGVDAAILPCDQTQGHAARRGVVLLLLAPSTLLGALLLRRHALPGPPERRAGLANVTVGISM